MMGRTTAQTQTRTDKHVRIKPGCDSISTTGAMDGLRVLLDDETVVQ